MREDPILGRLVDLGVDMPMEMVDKYKGAELTVHEQNEINRRVATSGVWERLAITLDSNPLMMPCLPGRMALKILSYGSNGNQYLAPRRSGISTLKLKYLKPVTTLSVISEPQTSNLIKNYAPLKTVNSSDDVVITTALDAHKISLI